MTRCKQFYWKDKQEIPLEIVSQSDEQGYTMDEVVGAIGLRNNCGFCGVFRRQCLDKAALKLGCTQVLTGHNADDTAETILMNLLRGDSWRVKRCAEWYSGELDINSTDPPIQLSVPKAKPLKHAYEKEIVM